MPKDQAIVFTREHRLRPLLAPKGGGVKCANFALKTAFFANLWQRLNLKYNYAPKNFLNLKFFQI